MEKEIISELEQTSDALLQSINGLSEAQLTYKINPHVWSIHECLEHIVITEISVYRILIQTVQSGSSSADTERIGKEKMEKLMHDRSVKTEAPDDVKPIGRFNSINELTAKFRSNRERIVELLKNNSIIFDSHIIVHPMLGEMTKKDWLHFLVHHGERHCRQIEEIKSFVQMQV